MKHLLAIFAMCSVLGCSIGNAPQATVRTDPIAYVLDTNGVQLIGQQQRIDFGRTDHSAERAMTKLVGQEPVSRASCPDGRPIVVWPDGTRLYFVDGSFRGWSKDSPDGSDLRAGSTCA